MWLFLQQRLLKSFNKDSIFFLYIRYRQFYINNRAFDFLCSIEQMRFMVLTSWSSMLLEHLMSVAQPLGWSCREVMQFPRSLSPGISGVKTSRLFLGDIPARTKCVITLLLIFYYSVRGEPRLTSIIQFYTVISDLLCEDGSCWSHFPGEECRPTWTPMCLHLQNHNRIRNHFL